MSETEAPWTPETALARFREHLEGRMPAGTTITYAETVEQPGYAFIVDCPEAGGRAWGREHRISQALWAADNATGGHGIRSMLRIWALEVAHRWLRDHPDHAANHLLHPLAAEVVAAVPETPCCAHLAVADPWAGSSEHLPPIVTPGRYRYTPAGALERVGD